MTFHLYNRHFKALQSNFRFLMSLLIIYLQHPLTKVHIQLAQSVKFNHYVA